jgi:hypothetical protein
MYFIMKFLAETEGSYEMEWILSIVILLIFDLVVVENAKIFIQLKVIYYLSKLAVPSFSLQPLWKVIIPGKLLNLYD